MGWDKMRSLNGCRVMSPILVFTDAEICDIVCQQDADIQDDIDSDDEDDNKNSYPVTRSEAAHYFEQCMLWLEHQPEASTYNIHANLSHYSILGAILSHGFMSCGFLPIQLSFPVIANTLLGCDVVIPDGIIIESFIDFISSYESSIFHQALKYQGATFPSKLQESLMREGWVAAKQQTTIHFGKIFQYRNCMVFIKLSLTNLSSIVSPFLMSWMLINQEFFSIQRHL